MAGTTDNALKIVVIFVVFASTIFLTFYSGCSIIYNHHINEKEQVNIIPTIVQHYDKKTGKTRVYESTPHYDPVTKQSRPKRKYLGTLDPETGELIPSSGRRGRTASSKNVTTIKESPASTKITELQKTISEKENEIASLNSEIKALKAAIKSYEKVCASISNTLAKAPCKL